MEKVLSVKDLCISFSTYEGNIKAVRGVTFELKKGETLGIVGESGSGKSVMCKSLMGLIPTPPGNIDKGEIHYENEDILKLSEKDLEGIRGSKISIISQDPMSALNPTLTVKSQIIEGILTHQKKVSKKNAINQAIELLDLVGVKNASERINSYPHQFSGGMQQRVVIAIALACNPDVIIADEPTTALDVTVQAQVLSLLKEIQSKFGTSIIFITHDLGVVANIAHRVAVMYAGKIIEIGKTEEIFHNPKHPYSIGLLESVPNLENPQEVLTSIPGAPPNLLYPPKGDAFARRNKDALKIDFLYPPPMFKVSSSHYAATWLLHEKASEISNTFYKKEQTTYSAYTARKKDKKEKLLEITDLKKHFRKDKKHIIKAVNGISLNIYKGETFGLVGESGCGKSTLGRTIVNLYHPTSGEIKYKEKPLSKYGKYSLKKDIQMIFQDPDSSLNPRWNVEEIISEGLKIHGMHNKRKRKKKVFELLDLVGLKQSHIKRYPHEFSGGQRQRVGIARALAIEPEFIIADEPISALDVSIQAQIVNLLQSLQKQKDLTYLFIAHDLSMVRHISDRIGVMYQGELVEIAESDELYNNPLHEYTKSLLASVPVPKPNKSNRELSPYKPNIDTENLELKEVKRGHWVAWTEEEFKKHQNKHNNEMITIKQKVNEK